LAALCPQLLINISQQGLPQARDAGTNAAPRDPRGADPLWIEHARRGVEVRLVRYSGDRDPEGSDPDLPVLAKTETTRPELCVELRLRHWRLIEGSAHEVQYSDEIVCTGSSGNQYAFT